MRKTHARVGNAKNNSYLFTMNFYWPSILRCIYIFKEENVKWYMEHRGQICLEMVMERDCQPQITVVLKKQKKMKKIKHPRFVAVKFQPNPIY